VWALFAFLVAGMLAVDLLVGRRARGEGREPTFRSAALWSAAWIGLGLLFSFVVLALYGPHAQLTYVTAYLLEKSLSVDNIFVFVLIFSQLRIPPREQRRILYWGVLGALVMRGALIAGGMYLLDRFHWVGYVFAALIILAAVRMILGQEAERKAVVAACAACDTWVARILPVTPVLHGSRFWVRQGGGLVATPLLIALIVVETTDLVFAVDSFGLAGILTFVGAKMRLGDVVDIPTWVSLAVVAGALGLSVMVSLILPPRPAETAYSR
jgi:tellurite resistance protein TerC